MDKAALFAGMSVQDAFRVLWEELPCSVRLVDGGGPELDTVVTFANVIAEASEQGDAGVAAFLEALDAGEHGPGWTAHDVVGADAVQVLTAHGAVGMEFDTVIVAGATEGNFPSSSRPEPMFDLEVAGPDPHAFGAGARTPGGRAPSVPDGARAGAARRRARRADAHPDADELDAAVAVRGRAGPPLDRRRPIRSTRSP